MSSLRNRHLYTHTLSLISLSLTLSQLQTGTHIHTMTLSLYTLYMDTLSLFHSNRHLLCLFLTHRQVVQSTKQAQIFTHSLSFTLQGIMLKIFGHILKAYLVFGKILNLAWQMHCCQCPKLDVPCSHMVTLATTALLFRHHHLNNKTFLIPKLWQIDSQVGQVGKNV